MNLKADKYVEIANNLSKWSRRRPVGHALRSLFSGSNIILRYGIDVLCETSTYGPTGLDYLKFLYSEGISPAIAWTIAPHLADLLHGEMARVRYWIQMAGPNTDAYKNNLPGLEDLSTRKKFALPNRWDTIIKAESRQIKPVQNHPNFFLARNIAKYLIEEKIV